MWTSESKETSYTLPKYKGKKGTDILIQKGRKGKGKRVTGPPKCSNPARPTPLGYKVWK